MAGTRYQSQYVPHDAPRGIAALAYAQPGLDETLDLVEHFAKQSAVTGAQERATNDVLSGGNPSPVIGVTDAGRVYNQAAAEAYQARTQMDLRGKAAELSAQFTGINPSDPQNFAKVYDAHISAVVSAVPERFRPAIAAEAAARRNVALAGITETANQYEFKRNDSAISAGIEQDIMEGARLARDGAAPEVIGALYTRADTAIDSRVSMGLIAPAEAEIQKAQYRSAIQSEALYGQAIRGGDLPALIHDLMTGGKSAEGMTLKDRDSTVAKITTEMHRQHAAMEMQAAESDLASKDIRDTLTTSLWANIYSGDPAKRPTPAQIVDAAATNLINDSEAQQMIKTLATDKAARNDNVAIGQLESEMANGIDIRAHIADKRAAGVITPEVAADLEEKNAANQRRDLPAPVMETRNQIDKLYTLSGPFSKYVEGETERKVSALRFFDEQVRSAPDGVDPETGLPLREIVAKRALSLLAQRKRLDDVQTLLAVPPRGAFLVQPTKPGEPVKLDIGKTVKKLRTDEMVGLVSPDDRRAEMRLIQQWEDAGLTVH